MFKHILVAIDFSPAWPVLKERLDCIREWGVERVTLAYVMSSRYPASPEEGHREHYQKRLEEEAAELREMGYSVDCDIRSGEPGARLAEAARGHGADMILIGARSVGAIHAFFMGSTALDVLRLATMPVWMEPVGVECEECMDVILLATDGSQAVRNAEQVFIDLSARFDKKIALTVVAGDDDSELGSKHSRTHLESLAEQVDGLDCRIVEGDPNKLVAETTREVWADLTVIGKRGRNPMADLLLGSTAEAVARRARRPVLMVPGDKRSGEYDDGDGTRSDA